MTTIMSLMADEESREFLKLEVDPTTKERFRRLCRYREMTHIGAGTRIFLWFMKQEETVQQLILGQISDAMKPVAIQMLRDGLITLSAGEPTEAEREMLEGLREQSAAGTSKPRRKPQAG